MEPTLEIDALGLLCPLPVLRLRKRIASLAPGSLVRVLADDPVADIDIRHFCAETGHEFIESTPIDGVASGGPDKLPRAYLLKITESD